MAVGIESLPDDQGRTKKIAITVRQNKRNSPQLYKASVCSLLKMIQKMKLLGSQAKDDGELSPSAIASTDVTVHPGTPMAPPASSWYRHIDLRMGAIFFFSLP